MSARLPSKPVENEETRDAQSRESIHTNSIVMLAELPPGQRYRCVRAYRLYQSLGGVVSQSRRSRLAYRRTDRSTGTSVRKDL